MGGLHPWIRTRGNAELGIVAYENGNEHDDGNSQACFSCSQECGAGASTGKAAPFWMEEEGVNEGMPLKEVKVITHRNKTSRDDRLADQANCLPGSLMVSCQCCTAPSAKPRRHHAAKLGSTVPCWQPQSNSLEEAHNVNCMCPGRTRVAA